MISEKGSEFGREPRLSVGKVVSRLEAELEVLAGSPYPLSGLTLGTAAGAAGRSPLEQGACARLGLGDRSAARLGTTSVRRSDEFSGRGSTWP